jgi:uncharacterized repeat protein (TIGR03847 family)
VSEASFDNAERIAVGAFGEPGQRVFLLQVAQGNQVLTVKVEKGQVAEMATHLLQAMADLPAVDRVEYAEAAVLSIFAEPEWVVGSIRLGYEGNSQRIAMVLEEFLNEEQQAAGAESESALILISTTQAAALASEAGELVAAGRPPCPHCGYPLDPSGHVCPKSNGHRPPKL